ncbi:T6SS effector amidase Tae4 family protein [Massilia rhizosphaerae]|uniref:T6SS effector amidase Tae4 family protein n=1 Tax=Massilia rhizosphaerae TaxID=2784389 RepID=UPI0018DB4A88|nr:T6SS effector amidase Tae4 family protein [Massilia rhizosphaerae]
MTKTLVQHAKVRTNTVKDSVCKIDVPAVQFSDLWENYVTGDPYRDPKSGKIPFGFENQCAIRVSLTLHKVGVAMKSYRGPDRMLIEGKPVAVRAQELAKWLALQPFCGLPTQPEEVTGENWKGLLAGRTGIVFFHGYWHRPGEATSRLSGDHIDLWNKNTLTPSVESFLRFRLGINHVPNIFDRLRGGQDNFYSDLGKSRQILFWEVK